MTQCLDSTQRYFTSKMVVSTFVRANRAHPVGSPQPSTGCWQTFSLMPREEAAMNWVWTYSCHISQRHLHYNAVQEHKPTIQFSFIQQTRSSVSLCPWTVQSHLSGYRNTKRRLLFYCWSLPSDVAINPESTDTSSQFSTPGVQTIVKR